MFFSIGIRFSIEKNHSAEVLIIALLYASPIGLIFILIWTPTMNEPVASIGQSVVYARARARACAVHIYQREGHENDYHLHIGPDRPRFALIFASKINNLP